MKVLFITHQYFPYFYTGTELLTDNLSRYARNLGVETEVWAYNIEGDRRDKVDKTFFNKYFVTFLSHHKNDPRKDWLAYRNPNSNQKVLFEKMLREFKPDVIHITHLSRMGDLVDTAHRLGIPYIITLTDFWCLCPSPSLIRENGDLCEGTNIDQGCLEHCFRKDKDAMQERQEGINYFFQNAAVIIYASNFLREKFKENGFDTSKWLNIRHGYNPKSPIRRVKDKFYCFAFTGTLQPHKGAHLAIKAFLKLKDENTRLAIYGDEKHNPSFSSYCRSLANDNTRIEFRGRYDHTKLDDEFKDIDCMIIPSVWYEPFPFTLTAAISCGFQVIGAKIGGIPEIIGRGNIDSLFESSDVTDLKDKMAKKVKRGKKNLDHIFYDQCIETEAFKYFQIYNFLKK